MKVVGSVGVEDVFVEERQLACCTTRWQKVTVTWDIVAKEIRVLLISRQSVHCNKRMIATL